MSLFERARRVDRTRRDLRHEAEHAAHNGSELERAPEHGIMGPLKDPAEGLATEPSVIATRTLDGGGTVTIQFRNRHKIVLQAIDNWLIIRGDSTLTVRPVNESEIYIRPVGYIGGWIPSFAAKPLGVHRKESISRIKQARRKRKRIS